MKWCWLLLVGFIFWRSDFDIGYIFFYSQTSSSCRVYTHIYICVFAIFYMNLSFIFKRINIFHLRSDSEDPLLCFWVAVLHLLSDLSKDDSTNHIPVFTSRLHYSWRDIKPNKPFTRPVSPAQLTVGVVLKPLKRACCYCSLIFLYRLYMQNGCGGSFLTSTRYGLAVQPSRCWPQMFVLERHVEGMPNVFSLVSMNWRVSVSVSVGVCSNLLFVLERGTSLLCVW